MSIYHNLLLFDERGFFVFELFGNYVFPYNDKEKKVFR